MKCWLLAAALSGLFLAGTFAQDTVEAGIADAEPVPVDSAPALVVFHGEELFRLAAVSEISAESRSDALIHKLKRMAKSPLVGTESFRVIHTASLPASAIVAGDEAILGVWESDAELNGKGREELAQEWTLILKEVVDQYRRDYTKENYIKGTLFALVATAVLLLIWFVIRALRRRELHFIERRLRGRKTLKFLDGESIISLNAAVTQVISGLVLLGLFLIYLNVVLSFFPWTYNLSSYLFEMISTPVIHFGHAFVENLPNLFAIAVIVGITLFVLRGFKHIFSQIGDGKVRIKGFYSDWADTTYGLIRLVVIVFAAVVAWPNIPGSDTAAFKGISIFMGVLVSLGSSSAMGNIFGGLMLTYMRSFQPGDFVKINDMRGTVMARRAFSTRLKTPTNEIISIPNQAVSSNPIVNYSRMTKSIGVNIGTAVTIGYDVPWRKVHALLLKSAEGVPDVLEDPAPAILQLGLEDFYVTYKLVVSTKNPAGKFRILSNLHQNVQDNFAKAGVEIMSPHYQGNRSAEAANIPDDIMDVEI